MKKSLAVVCISVLPMLHAFDQGHTFEFYKAKTIEVLPILGINPSTLSFTAVGHEPTIVERQENPHVVFLNVERLNSLLSVHEAIFECLTEAQLSCMSEKMWQSLIPEERPVSPILTWMPHILLLPLGCYCFKWLTHHAAISPAQEISFMALTIITTAISLYLFSYPDEGPTMSAKIKNNFEQKKFFIQIDTLQKLFNSHTYAPIAARSTMLIRCQHSNIKTHGFADIDSFELDKAIQNMSRSFTRWTETYPDAFEKSLRTKSLTL